MDMRHLDPHLRPTLMPPGKPPYVPGTTLQVFKSQMSKALSPSDPLSSLVVIHGGRAQSGHTASLHFSVTDPHQVDDPRPAYLKVVLMLALERVVSTRALWPASVTSTSGPSWIESKANTATCANNV
jgi:hypothetical protein